MEVHRPTQRSVGRETRLESEKRREHTRDVWEARARKSRSDTPWSVVVSITYDEQVQTVIDDAVTLRIICIGLPLLIHRWRVLVF